ncbi:hypothetical protein BDV96DRAFT_117705 [Lophiotrema nucula]|uniref:Uncharacterized protein n=1 Tax=Lophiotrema nucula TaxID=690887 RepID=A0A6A5Z649_9PLEO|nr:hypothetical protein BDV96DRAFT_117705 [Lophiotrema nucula]
MTLRKLKSESNSPSSVDVRLGANFAFDDICPANEKIQHLTTTTPGWHNWSARKTLNLKVVGSNPTSGSIVVSFCFSFYQFFASLWSRLDQMISESYAAEAEWCILIVNHVFQRDKLPIRLSVENSFCPKELHEGLVATVAVTGGHVSCFCTLSQASIWSVRQTGRGQRRSSWRWKSWMMVVKTWRLG